MTTNFDASQSALLVIKDVQTGQVSSVVLPENVQIGLASTPGELILTGRLSLTARVITFKSSDFPWSSVQLTDDDIVLSYVTPGDGGTYTVILPPAPRDGQFVVIKDTGGNSNVDTIIVSSGDASILIDSSSTGTITNAYGFIGVCWINEKWNRVFTSATGSGGGAPIDAKYIVVSNNPSLTDERALTATSPVTLTDNGANSNINVSLATQSLSPGTYTNTTLTVNSYGIVTGISTGSGGSGGGGDPNATYIVNTSTASLPNALVLTDGTGIRSTIVGSLRTLSINDGIVATISGSTFTGAVKFNSGLSGSLTTLTNGTSYIRQSPGILVTSVSNGAVTIGIDNNVVATISGSTFSGPVKFNVGLSGSLTNLSDGTSFIRSGVGVLVTSTSNGPITVGIDNNVVATISGSTFTGPVKFNQGLSGSLQQLVTGISYLAESSAIEIISQSNGQLTIGVSSHQDLPSLQGGTATERYHLTSASYELVTNPPSLEPLGFVDRTSSTFSWNFSTKTLTFQPAGFIGGSYTFYEQGGVKYTISSPVSSSISTPSAGLWWFYFDGGVLQNVKTSTPYGFATTTAAALYLSSSNDAIAIMDERHGLVMDWRTHQYLHRTIGTRYDSGLATARITTGTGTADGDAQVFLTSGVIWDEDIQVSINRTATPTNFFDQELGTTGVPGKFPIYYRVGTGSDNWNVFTATNFPVYQSSAGVRVAYNSVSGATWSVTTAGGNGDRVCMFIVATNDVVNPVIAIMGQIDDTLTNVQNFNWADMQLGNLPFNEMKPLCKLIFQTSTSHANSIKAYVNVVTDLRASSPIPAGTFVATSHSSLTGLSDPNSHPASAISTSGPINGILTASETNVQLALDKISDNTIATISGSTFTGAVKFNAGLSGSLTQLTNGSAYIRGSGITVTTGSGGWIELTGSAGSLLQKFQMYPLVSSVATTNYTNATPRVIGTTVFNPNTIVPISSGYTRSVVFRVDLHTTDGTFPASCDLYDLDGITGAVGAVAGSTITTYSTSGTELSVDLSAALGTLITTGSLQCRMWLGTYSAVQQAVCQMSRLDVSWS